MKDKEIVPIAMPGTHEAFFPFIQKELKGRKLRILDIGAGHGAFSKKLHELGHDVLPIDLFPETFRYPELICIKVDITKPFPLKDGDFDIAIAIEVVEHINDHEVFFAEVNRVLKKEGKLFISTPNILSLKSRFRFLLTGFFYSFNALNHQDHGGLQHISSITLDQYNYMAMKYGFEKAKLSIDRKQKSSMWLYIIAPLIWLYMAITKRPKTHNQKDLLFGRLLLLQYNKQ